jgi:hypothetical protein
MWQELAMSYLGWAGIVLAVSSLPAIASSSRAGSGSCGMYPSEVQDSLYSAYSGCLLHKLGEKPLWHGVANKHHRQEIRFTFTEGHATYTRVIDFVEYLDGTGSIAVTSVFRRPDPWKVIRQRRIDLSATEVARLNELGDQSGTWGFPNGSWDGDGWYLHCETLDMERVNASGYRYSSVNISCNQPTKLMPLVEYLTGLAKVKLSDSGLY